MPDRTIPIQPNDPRIHVLAADPAAGIETSTHLSRLRGEAATGGIAEALGAPVDPEGVEVFSAADVEAMGLRAYLAEAYDADPAALEAEAAWLDGLRGTVVVVTPRAMPGGGTLKPGADLTYVGAYPTARADHAAAPLPEAEARTERVATPATATGTPLSRKTLVWIVLAALALAAILVLAL